MNKHKLHRSACPNHGENCQQYHKGWSAGFGSRIDEKHPPQGNSECFAAGYRQGVKDIDDAADEAFQRQYSLDG